MSECHIYLTTLLSNIVYIQVCASMRVSKFNKKMVSFTYSKMRRIISLTWPYINLCCLPEIHQCLLAVANFICIYHVKYSCLLATIELNSRIGNICTPKYTKTFRIMIRITQSVTLFHFQYGSSLCFIRRYILFICSSRSMYTPRFIFTINIKYNQLSFGALCKLLHIKHVYFSFTSRVYFELY